MSTVYRSKVDLWLIILLLVVVALPIAAVVFYAYSWITLVVCLAFVILVFYCIFSIKYVIDDNTLHVKCGIFADDKVNIMDIIKLTPTRLFLSAPAASLDRIAIYLTKQRTPVLISPKNKNGFIKQLKSINPNIEIDIDIDIDKV